MDGKLNPGPVPGPDGAEVHRFRARMDDLGAACDAVAAFCARQGVAHDDMLRLTLLVEELFTNTVDHGHGGDSDAAVQLALAAEPTRLHLHYQDEAPPFNPLQPPDAPPPVLDGDAGARLVGGLGLLLLRQMAHEVAHDPVPGGNRLRLVLRRNG